jgi:hypothetical protein
LILQLNRACVEGNDDLSQEVINVILRADLLIGPYIANSNPDVLKAWLGVRTLALSMYLGSSSEEDGDEALPANDAVGTIWLLPLSSPAKSGKVRSTVDDPIEMDDSEDMAPKTKQSLHKITTLGPIKTSSSKQPANFQESKKVVALSSSAVGKAAVKAPVDHEPFVGDMHKVCVRGHSSPPS